MKVLDFINEHPLGWKNVLTSPPYNLTIKEDGDYFLLKYDMLKSDFNEEMVREARGSIFYAGEDKYECVCYPFKKFFNYGEPYADKIDWNSAYVTEKIDGSLMKLWYHKGWHLSTNGTIDAYKAPINDSDLTFGKLFDIAIGRNALEWAADELFEDFTYLFELVSPETRIVISYDKPMVYFLTSYYIEDFSEQGISNLFSRYDFIHLPKRYNLNNLNDVIEVVNTFDDKEGVVVADAAGHRIKVKSPLYLEMHHMVNNGAITPKRILKMIEENTIDDFLAYFPEYKSMFDDVMLKVNTTAVKMRVITRYYMLFDSVKKVGLYMKPEDKKYSGYIFKCYKDNTLHDSFNYLFSLGYKKLSILLDY